MTNEQYLETYHELTNKVLAQMAIRHGEGEHESAGELLTQLRTKQSDLWTGYMTSASAGVNP